METCRQHKRGSDIVEMGYWLCADCYTKMPSQPIKWGLEMFGDGERPSIIWRAESPKSVEGLTLNDFLRTSAHRYQYHDRSLSLEDAYGLAIEMLEGIGEKFADECMEWSHSSAREIVDCDVNDYWEEEPDTCN